MVLTAVRYLSKTRIIKIFHGKANSKNLPLESTQSSVHEMMRKDFGFFCSSDTEHENSEVAEAEGSSVNSQIQRLDNHYTHDTDTFSRLT